MQAYASSGLSGHALACFGVLTLHVGLAAWAMTPKPPVAMPQQQVMAVRLLAPAAPPPEPVVTPAVTRTAPPKPKGMVKAAPSPQPAPPARPQPVERAEAPPAPAVTQAPEAAQPSPALAAEPAVTQPVPADYLQNPPPVYPRHARARRQQGTVMLDVRVTAEGTTDAVSVERSSGYSTLDRAALEAVRQWRFVPAQRGSERVEARVVVPIEFRIN